jgi:hypothetical protein
VRYDIFVQHPGDRVEVAIDGRPHASPIPDRIFESVRNGAVSKIDMVFGQIL